jgi:hypothetical protein
MSKSDDYKYNTVNDDHQEVSTVTLNCLMNQEQYGKYLEDKKPKNQKNKRKDRKFYKKRILEITKQLLSASITNTATDINKDIQIVFDRYIDTCIERFKIIDKTDIIQSEHGSAIYEPTVNDIPIDAPSLTAQEADKELLMSNSKIIHTNTTLDAFVKVKTNKPREKEIIPVQKDINLKDPALKNKGIRKKKNITNKYDTDTKSS